MKVHCFIKMKTVYGIVNVSDSTVKCVFCTVNLERQGNDIDEHVAEEKHKENAGLFEENGISFDDEDRVYCKPCNKLLLVDESISEHVDEEKHATWIAAISELIENEYLDISGYLASDANNNSIFCEACDDEFLFSLSNVEAHVNGQEHRAKVVEKLKPMNGIFKVANNYEMWCKLCDLYIVNSVNDIFQHIDEDETHNEWLVTIDKLVADQSITIDEYLANEHEQNALCTKCDVKMPCNVENLEEHIKSTDHNN